MVPGENLKLKNTPRKEVFARGYKFAGGNYRYGWVVCPKDQTLVIWDCVDDAVDYTVTLTASKDFSWGFYRSIDKSVYVMGNAWFDRVDLDPDNIGTTFGTVVESGDTDLNTVVGNYLPYPLDAICSGRAAAAPTSVDFEILPVSYMRKADKYDLAKYYTTERRKWANSAARFGHSTLSDARYHPLNNLLEVDGEFYHIMSNSCKYFHDNRKFKFVRADDYSGALSQGSRMMYLFKNFIPAITGATCYIINRTSTTNIISSFSTGGSSAPAIMEYCPDYKKFFIATKTSSTVISVNQLGNRVVTNLGTINRTAYKATNEDSTDDMMYNPVYKKLYVQGHRHSSTPDTGVNLVHVYDPSQAVVADMYQSSITVGEMGGTQRSGNYATNCMGFNGNRYWESEHGI